MSPQQIMPKPHLRRISESPLALVRYWFEEITYLGAGRGRDVAQLEVRASRPEVATQTLDDEEVNFVRLRVKAESPDGHSIDVTIAGAFRVASDSISGSRRERLVLYNGSSILFGLLRGMVGTVTGASGVPVRLPSLNFAELIERDQVITSPRPVEAARPQRQTPPLDRPTDNTAASSPL